jgi:hypothetical protein
VQETTPRELAALSQQFTEVCARAGLVAGHVNPELTRRMLLLAEHTLTFDDCVRAIDVADEVFAFCEQGPHPFNAADQMIVRVGSLFSDIGKTGPASASLSQQHIVARLFAIEGVRDEQVSLGSFIEDHFPGESQRIIDELARIGVHGELTLRQFWNLHSRWTFEILESSTLPVEAVAAAATHHLLEHANPGELVDENDRFTRDFGTNIAFDRPEKLVILLDKYDAVRRRGRRDHAGAMEWLRELIETHPRFGRDAEFRELLDVLDAALRRPKARLYVEE